MPTSRFHGSSQGIGGVSTHGRPCANSVLDFRFAVVALAVAQGKGAERTLRLELGLQAGPDEGGENRVEMQMQFGLRTGLTI